MRSERDKVKQRIVEATIACIEKRGVSKITTRVVAKEAGVNVASINYYFGTKENLLEDTFRTALDHFFFDIQELFTVTELHSYSLSKVFFSFLLEGILHYPRLVQILIFNEQIAPRFRETLLRHFSSYIQMLATRIQEENPACSALEANMRVVQMLHGVLSVCHPFQLHTTVGCDLRDPSLKERYLDLLLSRYIDWIPQDKIESQRELVQKCIRKLFESK